MIYDYNCILYMIYHRAYSSIRYLLYISGVCTQLHSFTTRPRRKNLWNQGWPSKMQLLWSASGIHFVCMPLSSVESAFCWSGLAGEKDEHLWKILEQQVWKNFCWLGFLYFFFLESPPVGGNGLGPTNGQHLFLGHQGTTPKWFNS